jgi:hypothetical protein
VGDGIAVDSAGNAYVTGETQSSQASFPETVGPDLSFSGTEDAFVAKVNAAGTGLVYAGYIGGGAAFFSTQGLGIAVDSTGHAYVTGRTTVPEAHGFPVTVGPDLTYNGKVDAFVAKVKADGTGLDYAGYIGGAEDENVQNFGGIAVDSAGNAYVTGDTNSPQATFPETVGPDLTFNGGSRDAFVAKVKADGTGLDYAGYIGGAGTDEGRGIAVDSAGNAYVTGRTGSPETSFPETVGPDLTFNGGNFDAFVAKVNAAGTALDYAGYIGGADSEVGNGIAVDSAGDAYITGSAGSSEDTFPNGNGFASLLIPGPDQTFNGPFGAGDAFVAKVNAAGTGLVYAGYIGGTDTDTGNGIAVDGAGNAYVTGATNSSEATFPVSGGPDVTFNGFVDAFVAKVNAAGTGLVYGGYIGGAGIDQGFGIAVDGAGDAYVTGHTLSNQATFPNGNGFASLLIPGPDQTYNGNGDAFVAKISEIGPPGTDCSSLADDTPCEDGNACTTNDTCQSGTCKSGPPPDCDDANQ